MNSRAKTEALAKDADTVRFAHESEEEFARLLDFYGVAWQYEPRTFTLREEAGHGTPVAMGA